MEQRLKPNQLQSPQVHVIWQQLQQIPDPELPALSITDLGMIRNVVPNKQGWKVIFTPTYSGCPATEFLINEIKTVLGKAGFQNIDIEVMLTPAWTTDWMNQDAKRRLREFGIAPRKEHPVNTLNTKVLSVVHAVIANKQKKLVSLVQQPAKHCIAALNV